MEKPEGERPLGRPRRRCEDNIKMDLQAVGVWAVPAQTGSRQVAVTISLVPDTVDTVLRASDDG